MLIACKCLNFVGSTGQVDQKLIQSNNDENSKNDPNCLSNTLTNELKRLQLGRRINFNCLEFLRQAIGPISDLTTTINQNDLIYKVPLDSWLLYYCINCNKITHGKHKTNKIYLINSKLLTNKAEVNSLKTSKSFSTAFDILMIDHQPTTPIQTYDLSFGSNSASFLNQQQQLTTTTATINNENIFNFQHSSSNSNIISSTSINDFNNITSTKIQQQKRLRNLNQMLQQRLQKEISDTDERIRRYSEQQFVLLKNFREKSEQEYQMLVSLMNQVPDELKVIDAIDDNITPTTPTTNVGIMKTNDNTNNSNNLTKLNSTNSTNLTTITKTKGAIDNTQQEENQQPSLLVFNNSDQQQQQQTQIPNIETPPGTPENVPMSVGNSPTFRPQQQQQHQQQNNIYVGGQQRSNLTINNTNDDCLFELDEFEVYQGTDQSQNMSDVEECEDAADALGELSTGMNIPKNMGRRGSNSIAKSLPIKIANMGGSTAKYEFEDLEDEVGDDTIDIAASIKALAKSVHGNTIFGELPRPRFSTQI